MADRRSSPGATVFSTNKTNHHDITEILLKVVLSTINLHIEDIANLIFITYLLSLSVQLCDCYLLFSDIKIQYL